MEKIALIIVWVLFFGFLYRWRGVSNQQVFGQPMRHPFIQIMFTFPAALLAYYHCAAYPLPEWFPGFLWPWAAGLFAWTVALAGVVTGHGNGQDLGAAPRGKPEKLEYLILWLEPYMPPYWYDALLLLVIGVVTVLGLFLVTMHPAYLLLGVAPPFGYMIGRDIYNATREGGLTDADFPRWLKSPTDWGELCEGLAWGILTALVITP